MSRLGQKLLWWPGLLVSIAAVPLTVRANSVSIFNSFGPGHTSDCCSGLSEYGSTWVPLLQISAMAFTPNVTSRLGAIDVALASGGSLITSQFTLALMTDVGGQPGSILESWNLVSTFEIAACGHCFETVFSTQNLVLQAGTQYWLVPFPGPDAFLNWQENLVGASGTRAFSFDGGKTWSVSSTSGSFAPRAFGAFDVRNSTSATVPEPSTIILLGSGVVGIAARWKLRRPPKSVRAE